MTETLSAADICSRLKKNAQSKIIWFANISQQEYTWATYLRETRDVSLMLFATLRTMFSVL